MNLTKSELAVTANALSRAKSVAKKRLADAENKINLAAVLALEEKIRNLTSARDKIVEELWK